MHSDQEHNLSANHILSMRCAAPQMLHVISGCVWITQSNDSVDYFIRAGESMLLHSERCVIEAQLDSRLRVSDSTRPAWNQRRHRYAASAIAIANGWPPRWLLAWLNQRPFSG